MDNQYNQTNNNNQYAQNQQNNQNYTPNHQHNQQQGQQYQQNQQYNAQPQIQQYDPNQQYQNQAPPTYYDQPQQQQQHQNPQGIIVQPLLVQPAMIGQPMILPTHLDNMKGPTFFKCLRCNNQAISVIKAEPGNGTYICCILLCCVSGILGFVPFYVDDCQDKIHICPGCGSQVGKNEYKPCG